MNENKEYITHPDDMGTIHVSEDVIAAIAASAATEIEGVAGLMGGSKRIGPKGVKITIAEEKASVDVYIMVRYGQPIPEVAEKVQATVAGAIESMTGFSVSAVNVHVGGVAFA